MLANRALTMIAATRPAFPTASVLPVLVAGALVSAQGIAVDHSLLALAVLNIALIHGAANVLNDYFDSRSGADALNEERIYPFSGGSRFIQNGVLTEREMGALGAILISCGAALGLWMALLTGPTLLLMGLAGGALAIFYTAPPCLACRGLGDLAVATCFGVLPLAGTSLILSGQVSAGSLWLGGSIGCFVAGILWANSIPDILSDRASGKMTLPVRLGAKAAEWGLVVWFLAGFLLVIAAPLPKGAWLALGAVAPARLAGNAAIAGRLQAALPLTILTHAAFCVLLISGFLIIGH